MRWDPRLYQIATLAGLLVYGMGWLGLDIDPPIAATILLTVLATQFAAARLTGLPRFDPRSALISGLSLCLLLRTNSPALAALAAVVAIASKFAGPRRGKHVFNPTNVALVRPPAHRPGLGVARAVGQRGVLRLPPGLPSAALVVNRAARSDVTLAFLAAYAALVFGALAVAGRAADDSAPPPPERRAAALRVLHDLRPAHHARLARRARPLRRPRRVRRLVRASSACSAPTACSGRWPSARSSSR